MISLSHSILVFRSDRFSCPCYFLVILHLLCFVRLPFFFDPTAPICRININPSVSWLENVLRQDQFQFLVSITTRLWKATQNQLSKMSRLGTQFQGMHSVMSRDVSKAEKDSGYHEWRYNRQETLSRRNMSFSPDSPASSQSSIRELTSLTRPACQVMLMNSRYSPCLYPTMTLLHGVLLDEKAM